MEILTLPNKILREKSIEVTLPLSKEDIKIANDMAAYIDYSQSDDNDVRAGVGLSAIQWGIKKRMFYIHMNETEENFVRDVIINPVLIGESQLDAALKNGEGCLSVLSGEDQEGFVHRKNRVMVKGYSFYEKKMKTWDVSGYTAIVFQHELDHLDGKLYIDRINKNERWVEKEGEHLI